MVNRALIDLETLRGTIQDAIDEGRIGTPQFFRCMVTVSEKEEFETIAGEIKSLADDFFGGVPSLSHEIGSDGIYSTEMLKWPKGQSAIITVSRADSGKYSNLDLMTIGSRGALYHDDLLEVRS